VSDIVHIEAILKLADSALSHGTTQDRCGVYSALLSESLPFLRELVESKRRRAEGLAVLRRELELAESNATERSDPASNEENDAEVRRLRELICQHEVGA
jgi:hypothetical protein